MLALLFATTSHRVRTRYYRRTGHCSSSQRSEQQSWRWLNSTRLSPRTTLREQRYIVGARCFPKTDKKFLLNLTSTALLAYYCDDGMCLQFHADLYHMTMEIVSEEAKERIRETNHHFVDAVYSLLKATNIVTYSWTPWNQTACIKFKRYFL